MTAVPQRRGAEFLQWFGLLAAGLVWAAQLVIGFGVTDAACGPAGSGFHVDMDVWQIALMAVGVPIAALAEVAAVSVFLETRSLEHDDPPPWGRRHFFVVAAILGNVLFLVAILMSGIGAIYSSPCRGA
jgi:hypothetical protein